MESENAFDPTLTASLGHRAGEVGDDRLEAHLGRRHRIPHRLDLDLVLDHSQV